MGWSMGKAAASPPPRRYERKYAVPELGRQEFEESLRLHPALFSPIYQGRFVNNLYFDTPDLENYQDNVDGVSARVKIRIRWYGDLYGEIERPVLEIKHKRGHEGWKESVALAPFPLQKGFSARDIEKQTRSADLPGEVKSRLAGLELRLMNRYYRRYYRSADGKFRITVDSGLEWYRIAPLFNNLMNRSRDDVGLIVELKYDCRFDSDAARVSDIFPFRLTRSSKYVSGLDAVTFS